MGRRLGHLPALSALGVGLALGGACAPAPTGSPPTWAEHVAPRIARSCMPCHAGVSADGPPAIGELEGARRHGPVMAFMVDEGLMPPGGVDRSGSCRTYLGPAPFSDADARVLRDWVDAGMPAGDPTGLPDRSLAAPAAPRADRVVEELLPLSPEPVDLHRCFLVELGDGAPQLAGLGVAGGVVHHAMVFTVPESSAASARAQDAADPGPGWACPGFPAGAGELVATWVPGQPAATFPDGAAAALQPGPVVIQLHQHGAGPPEARVSLYLVDDAPRPVRTVPVAATDFTLPPGEGDVAIERTMPLPFGDDVLVLGVMPHLHASGRAASLTVEDGPCLVDAPRFDFAFQELAFYDTPVGVPAGARATLSCRWDTRDRTAPLRWGESSDDEMCTVFLFVSEAD